MTYDLPMPKSSKDRGWKVKIRNLERTEDPHVTIIWKTLSWRYNIRNTGFMDREPNPDQVPKEVVAHIEENRAHRGERREASCGVEQEAPGESGGIQRSIE